jgi:hypothetical protein
MRMMFSDLTYILFPTLYQQLIKTQNKTKNKNKYDLWLPPGGEIRRRTHTLLRKPLQAPRRCAMYFKLCSVLACKIKSLYFFWRFILIFLPWEPQGKQTKGRQRTTVYRHRSKDKHWWKCRSLQVSITSLALTWPWRSVLSSIMAQVRQCTPSEKEGQKAFTHHLLLSCQNSIQWELKKTILC